MNTDLIPAQVQAISLAGIAASLAGYLAVAQEDRSGVYRESAIKEVARAHAALDIIVAGLASERREAA